MISIIAHTTWCHVKINLYRDRTAYFLVFHSVYPSSSFSSLFIFFLIKKFHKIARYTQASFMISILLSSTIFLYFKYLRICSYVNCGIVSTVYRVLVMFSPLPFIFLVSTFLFACSFFFGQTTNIVIKRREKNKKNANRKKGRESQNSVFPLRVSVVF